MWRGRINPGHCGERRAMQRILSIMVYAPYIAAGLRRRRGGSTQNAPGSLKNLAGSQYSDPEFSFRRPIGITSIEFLADSNLPGYEDAVLVGEYAQGRLWLLRLNQNRDGFVLEGGLADGVLDDTDVLAAFGTGFGIVTDIQVGPDGALYILGLSADQVWRIGAIPEPHSWILSLVGLALIGCAVRKRCVA